MKKDRLITILILVGLVAGAILGQILHAASADPVATGSGWMELGNMVLVRPLKLLVLPLVFLSVIVGVTSIGDPSRLGIIGGATLVYYFSTMLVAVILGAVLVTTIAPGSGIDPEAVASLQSQGAADYDGNTSLAGAEKNAKDGLGGAWLNIFKQVVPTNIFQELVNFNPLGVSVFALLLGLALASIGEAGQPATVMFRSLFDGTMQLVLWILWLTPIGVFFLVAGTVAKIGVGALSGPLGAYMFTVFLGLALHAFITLPAVLAFFGRVNPYRFMLKMKKALLTAFGTDSSSATLPVTIETAIKEGGCSKRSANFVLPLGSTVNMDGTALYEAVAVVFMFQLWGIELGMGELVIVVVTATLAAVGAAGIPSAGLVTMVIVVGAVNTSLAGRGIQPLPLEAIGVIIGVDRILDMCRTTVNVWGDAVGARLMTRIAPDEEPDRAAA
ncbi:MAG: dicarboxylate/amino acid:cation symporter [Planctomycetota bacterium]|nr:dicarboxylate/amino acid:cation symporter [Planctomycetota bacterium]